MIFSEFNRRDVRRRVPRSFIGYLIPIMVLEKVTSFVLTTVTMMVYLIYWCREWLPRYLQLTSRARVTTRGRKCKSPKKSSHQYQSHYINDLRPELETTKKKRSRERTSGGGFTQFLRGYAINVSHLLMTRLTELTTKCLDLYHPQLALLTVLSAVQLAVRGSRVDTMEELLYDTQNHYIFDLRPEYGSDVAVMLFDVLEANWPGYISEPYFITKRRKRPRRSRFIKKSGWRPELVNSSRNKRVKKTMRPSDQRDLLASSAGPVRPEIRSRQSQEQCHTGANVQRMDQSLQHLEEQLLLKGPIQDSDQDIDVVPVSALSMNYIPKA